MLLERSLAPVIALRAGIPALLFKAVLAALVETAAFAATSTRLARKALALIAARARSRPFAVPWLVVLIPGQIATICSRVASPTGRAAAIPGGAIAATSEIT
ncbi:MAG TPA: hypothetical protein PK050_02405 [Hyphomonadaceae bacterium]|nr:hypothetical protein [Hyphomonadaceae bacterium]